MKEFVPVIKYIRTLKIQDVESGERARRYRKKAGLSLREAARRMGVSAAYLCDLEYGRRKWTIEKAKRFNKIFVT